MKKSLLVDMDRDGGCFYYAGSCIYINGSLTEIADIIYNMATIKIYNVDKSESIDKQQLVIYIDDLVGKPLISILKERGLLIRTMIVNKFIKKDMPQKEYICDTNDEFEYIKYHIMERSK